MTTRKAHVGSWKIRLSTCSGTKWLLAAEPGQQEMLVLLAGFSIRFFVPVQCCHLQQYCLCSCFVINWDKLFFVFGGHDTANSAGTLYKYACYITLTMMTLVKKCMLSCGHSLTWPVTPGWSVHKTQQCPSDYMTTGWTKHNTWQCPNDHVMP